MGGTHYAFSCVIYNFVHLDIFIILNPINGLYCGVRIFIKKKGFFLHFHVFTACRTVREDLLFFKHRWEWF